ncbi:hypothetical protein D3C76_684370 [compost metagenome]
MPIKPKPFTLVCEDCNWKKTIVSEPRTHLALVKQASTDAATRPRSRSPVEWAVVSARP